MSGDKIFKGFRSHKIYLENEIFKQPAGRGGREGEDLPCRELSEVVILDSKNHPTKLEELPQKGPFTAVAKAMSREDTKDGLSGSTVIVSPILEYSMEYPYGEGAVVWLRSSQAFYRVVSVAEPYQPVWQPLKRLLDITGHTINVLLRSGVGVESQAVVRRVGELARLGGTEVVRQIGAGRSFVLEQLRCQSSALARHQFVKDLAGAKTWMALRDSVAVDASVNGDSESEPLVRKMRKRIKAAPVAMKGKLPPPGSTGAHKGGPPPKAIKKKLPVPVQRARRTPSGLSLLPGNLKALPLPDELQFDYTCPFCGLTLSKSRSLARLKPRIELHLRQHESGTREQQQHKDFAKRFDRFLEYLGARSAAVAEGAAELTKWPQGRGGASGVPVLFSRPPPPAPVEGLAITEVPPPAVPGRRPAGLAPPAAPRPPPMVRSVTSAQPIDPSPSEKTSPRGSRDPIEIGGSPKKPKVYIDTTTSTDASLRSGTVPQRRDPIDLTDSPRPVACSQSCPQHQ